MAKFKVGEEVFWKDPEDTSSGWYKIISISGDIYCIKNEFSEAEVLKKELSYEPVFHGKDGDFVDGDIDWDEFDFS